MASIQELPPPPLELRSAPVPDGISVLATPASPPRRHKRNASASTMGHPLQILTGKRRPRQGWAKVQCPRCNGKAAYAAWTHYQNGAELWCSNGHQIAHWQPATKADVPELE